MRYSLLLPACLMAATTLSGCNDGTPKCDSTAAKNLVIRIAQKQLDSAMAAMKNSQMSGLAPANPAAIKLSVDNVRTTAHQSSPDVYQCAADLGMNNGANSTSIPVTYSVQQTDDGKQVYVSVSGL